MNGLKDVNTDEDMFKLVKKVSYWESVFTNLVNCNKKTMTVRFFEDENKVMTLGFDK